MGFKDWSQRHMQLVCEFYTSFVAIDNLISSCIQDELRLRRAAGGADQVKAFLEQPLEAQKRRLTQLAVQDHLALQAGQPVPDWHYPYLFQVFKPDPHFYENKDIQYAEMTDGKLIWAEGAGEQQWRLVYEHHASNSNINHTYLVVEREMQSYRDKADNHFKNTQPKKVKER